MIFIDLTKDEIREIISCVEALECEYGIENHIILEKLQIALNDIGINHKL